MTHALLLTGRPGVGKTTALRRLAALLAGWRLGGFYTEEIRAGGRRVGFRAVTFGGAARVIAHVAHRGAARVGAYRVDVGAVDDLADTALAPGAAADVLLVDEIGRMECLSARFVLRTRALLDAGRLVVATIGLRGGGFLAEVRARPDGECWTVTPANRDGVPARARQWLEARHAPPGTAAPAAGPEAGR
jgi:nucleoside-triphosphatase